VGDVLSSARQFPGERQPRSARHRRRDDGHAHPHLAGEADAVSAPPPHARGVGRGHHLQMGGRDGGIESVLSQPAEAADKLLELDLVGHPLS